MKIFLFFIVIGIVVGCCSDQINDIFSDKSIKDPTYNEMIQFVMLDPTDSNTYTYDYVCEDFSNDVIQNAKEKKIRAGLVHLDDPYGLGHAIVCFQTTDKGLYFLEPQLDIVFSKAEMDSMVSRCIYDIQTGYSYGYQEYFSMSLSSYNIEKWNNDII